jgi:hypothetical protein
MKIVALLIAAVSALKIKEGTWDQGEESCTNAVCTALNGEWFGPSQMDILNDYKGTDSDNYNHEEGWNLKEKYNNDHKNEWGGIDWVSGEAFGNWLMENSSQAFQDNAVSNISAWMERKNQPGYWDAYNDGNREANFWAQDSMKWEYERGLNDGRGNCTNGGNSTNGTNHTDPHHPTAGDHHMPPPPTDASHAPMCPSGEILMNSMCVIDTAANAGHAPHCPPGEIMDAGSCYPDAT